MRVLLQPQVAFVLLGVLLRDSVRTEPEPSFEFWNRFRNFDEVNRNKVREDRRVEKPNARVPPARERLFSNQLPNSGNDYEFRSPPKHHPIKKIEITKVNSSCALECIRNDPPQPDPEEESVNRGNKLPVPASGSLDQRDENYLMDNFLKKHLLKEDNARSKPSAQEVPYFSPNSESKFREPNRQQQPPLITRWSAPPGAKPQNQQPQAQEPEPEEADVLPSLFPPSSSYNRSCTEFRLTLQNILRDLGVICENGTKLFGTANGGSKMNLFIHLPFPACKVSKRKREVGGALTPGGLRVVYRLVPSSRRQRSSLLFGLPGQNGTENSYNVQIFVLNKKMTAPLIIQLKDVQDFVSRSPKTKNSKAEKAKKKTKTSSGTSVTTALPSKRSSTRIDSDSGAKNKRNTGSDYVFMRSLESRSSDAEKPRNGINSSRTMTNLTLNETEINSILESMGHLYPSARFLKFPTKNLTDPRIWSQIQNETDKFSWGHQI